MIEISSPTRVDLAGGTLDLWPLYLTVKEAVTVNVAIGIQTHVRLQKLADSKIQIESLDFKKKFEFDSLQNFQKAQHPELEYYQRVVEHFQITEGFQLTTQSESPMGGGLGGSSSLLVSMMKAFYQLKNEQTPTPEKFADIAHNIEAKILFTPTGTQDYIPAIHGGINIISYGTHGMTIETLEPDPIWNEHFLLVHTGKSHHSGLNNFEVMKRVVAKDPSTLAALQSLSEVSLRMRDACRQKRWDLFPSLFEKEYEFRIQLADAFSSPEIRELKELALSFGIPSVKICGAGGGGCVLIWCESAKQKKNVEEKCLKNGFKPLQVTAVGRIR